MLKQDKSSQYFFDTQCFNDSHIKSFHSMHCQAHHKLYFIKHHCPFKDAEAITPYLPTCTNTQTEPQQYVAPLFGHFSIKRNAGLPRKQRQNPQIDYVTLHSRNRPHQQPIEIKDLESSKLLLLASYPIRTMLQEIIFLGLS